MSNNDIRAFTVDRTGQRPIKFTGELLAEVESSQNNASPSYSGSPGSWEELKIYKTVKGAYVCQRNDNTAWQGGRDVIEVVVTKDLDEVIEFFGLGWLAKELYDEAGIESAEVIE